MTSASATGSNSPDRKSRISRTLLCWPSRMFSSAPMCCGTADGPPPRPPPPPRPAPGADAQPDGVDPLTHSTIRLAASFSSGVIGGSKVGGVLRRCDSSAYAARASSCSAADTRSTAASIGASLFAAPDGSSYSTPDDRITPFSTSAWWRIAIRASFHATASASAVAASAR